MCESFGDPQVWAQGKTLQISSVFYSLALLQVETAASLATCSPDLHPCLGDRVLVMWADLLSRLAMSATVSAMSYPVWHIDCSRCMAPASATSCDCDNAVAPSSEVEWISLAQLPQLYMATFFTRGVETVSELRVSIRRLDAFLALPEPPPPSHLSADGATAKVADMQLPSA